MTTAAYEFYMVLAIVISVYIMLIKRLDGSVMSVYDWYLIGMVTLGSLAILILSATK
jgi:hypothetical protein